VAVDKMSTATLTCDQAIFTSIRTPMGEGYRIIAASRGLRPEEKQAITRSSPSHDSLCWSADKGTEETENRYGVAFYTLPTGRFCVALSCYGGVEHTGRGGQRVYTHNVVCDEHDFPQCAYNPFAMLRAMVEAGLASAQLKPSPVLPELQLPIVDPLIEDEGATRFVQDNTQVLPEGHRAGSPGPDIREGLSRTWRGHVLEALLNDQSLVVNVEDGWLEAAEALLMGVPGPMRAAVSFSAGLRFSIGRCHRLLLLHGDQSVVKTRIAGRRLEYIDPATMHEPECAPSAWLSFVEHHWGCGDTSALARRTSRAFSDVSHDGRERVGRLYNEIDALSQTDTAELLAMAVKYLNEPDRGVESDIAAELVVTAQNTLLNRLGQEPWSEVEQHWTALFTMFGQSAEARSFAEPLVERALRAAAAEHPVVAAAAALEVARNGNSRGARLQPQEQHTGLSQAIDSALSRLAEWAEAAPDAELLQRHGSASSARDVVLHWRKVRPRCPVVQRLYQRCKGRAPLESSS
jgi:hypothetical protein